LHPVFYLRENSWPGNLLLVDMCKIFKGSPILTKIGIQRFFDMGIPNLRSDLAPHTSWWPGPGPGLPWGDPRVEDTFSSCPNFDKNLYLRVLRQGDFKYDVRFGVGHLLGPRSRSRTLGEDNFSSCSELDENIDLGVLQHGKFKSEFGFGLGPRSRSLTTVGESPCCGQNFWSIVLHIGKYYLTNYAGWNGIINVYGSKMSKL